MDITKLNEIAEKLESKYLPETAKGNEEAKEILAITQAYRILSVKAETTNDNSGLHLQRVSFSEERAEVCACGKQMIKETEKNYRCVCGRSRWLA